MSSLFHGRKKITPIMINRKKIMLKVTVMPKVFKVALLRIALEEKVIKKKTVRAIRLAPRVGDSVFIDSILSGC